MTRLLPLFLCAAAASSAHDMYLMPATFFPAKGAAFITAIHVGDAFPESEVSGRLERFKDARGISKSGSSAIRNLRIRGHRILGDAVASDTGHMVLAVHTTPVFIQLKPAKFTEYLKDEGLTGVISWREQHGESDKPGRELYSKYAKAILLCGAADGFFAHKTGDPIEIVPEADPASLKPGDSLPIQVLFRGEPAADLQVKSSWAGATGTKTTVAGRTGTDGRLKVSITGAGKWRIHTISMERRADTASADWESFWTSLTFAVKGR